MLKAKSTAHRLTTIARNGHRLRDMGLGTSRHEDVQLPCRRSRMICGRPRAACWDRSERKTCGLGKQLQPSSGRLRRRSFHEVLFLCLSVCLALRRPECAVELESAWICVEVRRDEESGPFVVDSTRAWPPHRIAGIEGVRLACRLQVE